MLNNYLCDFLSQEILKDAKKLLTRDELVVLHFIQKFRFLLLFMWFFQYL